MKSALLKIRNSFKQFGFTSTIKRFAEAALRPFMYISSNYVLVIPSRSKTTFSLNIECNILTKDVLNEFIKNYDIDEDHLQKIIKHVEEGSVGFYIVEESKVCGYAFLQETGEYRFGTNGYMRIPENYVLLKNLFVFPGNRGKSYGKYLNRARLNYIAENKTPIVFVVTDNKYAIRNLRNVGFKEVIVVKVVTYFSRRTTIKLVKTFNYSEISGTVINHLQNAFFTK